MEPISFLTASSVIAAAAIPLACGLVPPNRFFGVRTARTLGSPTLWYRVNRLAGVAVLVASAVSIGTFVAVPGLASGRSLAGLAIFLIPLLVALPVVAIFSRSFFRAASASQAQLQILGRTNAPPP